MKALPLHTQVDERWGLEGDPPSADIALKDTYVRVDVTQAIGEVAEQDSRAST